VKPPAEGGEATARKKAKTTPATQQTRSEAAAAPLTRSSAMATRGSRSEPTASMHMPSPEGLAALAAMLQAAASPVHGQPGRSSALASPCTGGIGSASQQAAREEQAGSPILHNVQEGLVRILIVGRQANMLIPTVIMELAFGTLDGV